MGVLHHKKHVLRGTPLVSGLGCVLKCLWSFGALGLQYAFFGEGDTGFRPPSGSQLADAERKLVEIDPSGGAVLFPDSQGKHSQVVGPQLTQGNFYRVLT